MKTNDTQPGPPFQISRHYDLPREKMWELWTDPKKMVWFGPAGVTTTVREMDLRSGGRFLYSMKTPDGKEMWGKWEIREVIKPDRLLFVTSFSDPKGGKTRHPLSETWPLEMLSTISFKSENGGTLVEIEWIPINATEAEWKTFNESHDGMRQGWTGTLDSLVEASAKA